MTCITGLFAVTSAMCIACCLPASSQAQAIYKCIAKGETPKYQSAPCASHQRVARALAYTPDPDAPPYRPDLRSRPDTMRVSRGRVTTTVQTAQTVDACERARLNRQTVLGRNNLGGNVDTRRVLNDAVADACY